MNARFLACLLLPSLIVVADAQKWVKSPFDGHSLKGWTGVARPNGENLWKVGKAKLDTVNPSRFAPGKGRDLINDAPGFGKSLNFYSSAVYGDVTLEIEVMVPKGSNSGIYLMGEYEVQVLDSFGNEANPGPGDMGALYGAQPPKSPKYLAPGLWNKFTISFQAAKFDASGKKTSNAVFRKVVLNGAVIHRNVEMSDVTPGGLTGMEKPFGPIMFQGDHGPVAYRNIRVSPLKP